LFLRKRTHAASACRVQSNREQTIIIIKCYTFSCLRFFLKKKVE